MDQVMRGTGAEGGEIGTDQGVWRGARKSEGYG